MPLGDPTSIELSVDMVSYNSEESILERMQPFRDLYENTVVEIDSFGDDGIQAFLESECGCIAEHFYKSRYYFKHITVFTSLIWTSYLSLYGLCLNL